MSFQKQERELQERYFSQHFSGKLLPGQALQLSPEHRALNLAPHLRQELTDLFDHSDPLQRIQWHRYANHGCSSQVCCVNFLYSVAQDIKRLQRWVEHITGEREVVICPIEERHQVERNIAFEWFPAIDYLNESRGGTKSRGANSTSVDAAIAYQSQGERCLLFIEWKYIESYSNTRSEKQQCGDITRDQRYHNLWRRPHGPLAEEIPFTLQDFYLEPWYQLLRQQMLAYHTELDPLSGYDRVSVAHISPSKNKALHTLRGERFKRYSSDMSLSSNTFELFRSLLAEPWRTRFIPLSVEDAFKHLRTDVNMSWLRTRYPNLF